MIHKVETLVYDPSLSFDVFWKNADRCFKEGMEGLIKYYLQVDLGKSIKFVTGLNLEDSWTSTQLIKILQKNYDSFPEEIREEIQDFGNRFETIMSDKAFEGKQKCIQTVKLMGLILRTLEIFPKFPPKMTNYMSNMDFNVVRKQYRKSQREMKNNWMDCLDYVTRFVQNRNSNDQNKASSGWGNLDFQNTSQKTRYGKQLQGREKTSMRNAPRPASTKEYACFKANLFRRSFVEMHGLKGNWKRRATRNRFPRMKDEDNVHRLQIYWMSFHRHLH